MNEELKYWQNVDLYIGGSEHATDIYYILVLEQILKDRGFGTNRRTIQKINQSRNDFLGMSANIFIFKR